MTISGFVAYVKQLWKNKPDTSTPLSAARLTHAEDGIKGNSDAIEKIAAAVLTQIVNDPNKIASMAALFSVNKRVDDVNSDLVKLKNYSNSSAQVTTDGYAGRTLEQYAKFIRGKGYENFSFVTTPTLSLEMPPAIQSNYECRIHMIYISGDNYWCQVIPIWGTSVYYCQMNLYSEIVGAWFEK